MTLDQCSRCGGLDFDGHQCLAPISLDPARPRRPTGLCVNDSNPICPPSKVLCAQCLHDLSEKMRRLFSPRCVCATHPDRCFVHTGDD